MPCSSCRSLYASNHSSQSTMCPVLTALPMLGRETARIVLHASCVVCEGDLPWRARKASCCASCWSALPAITGVKCNSCALPLEVGNRESGVGDASTPDSRLPTAISCIRCMEEPLPVEWSDAWGHYRGSLERL